jgi:hypothetical protein
MQEQSAAEQGTAADALQRPLRFRFQARLSAGVGLRSDTPAVYEKGEMYSPTHARLRVEWVGRVGRGCHHQQK